MQKPLPLCPNVLILPSGSINCWLPLNMIVFSNLQSYEIFSQPSKPEIYELPPPPELRSSELYPDPPPYHPEPPAPAVSV